MALINQLAENWSREKFWAKVTKDPAPDGCWTMRTARADGYATFSDRTPAWTHGEIYAHRIVWRDAHGGAEIPADLEIDHRCKNRACVNLAHLRLVTHPVNLETRVAPRVQPKLHRLTVDEILELRALRAAGASLRELGKVYGVSHTTARKAAVGTLGYGPELETCPR
jgi:hypothetical protein